MNIRSCILTIALTPASVSIDAFTDEIGTGRALTRVYIVSATMADGCRLTSKVIAR